MESTHISGSSSDQSPQLGHLSQHGSGSQKITTPPTSDYMGQLHFYVGTIQMHHLSIGFVFC
jgi:hypothetical protein